MSAWIVSREHIDVLVDSLLRSEAVDYGRLSPDELGRMLWLENVASIHARYPDTAESDSDYPGPVGFSRSDAAGYRHTRRPTPPVDALHDAWSSFNYQTCEHGGYEASEPFRWARAMIAHLETHPDYDPGHRNQGWDISEEYLDSLTSL